MVTKGLDGLIDGLAMTDKTGNGARWPGPDGLWALANPPQPDYVARGPALATVPARFHVKTVIIRLRYKIG